MLGNELYGAVRQLVIEIAVVPGWRGVLPQVRLTVAAHVRVPVDIAGQIAPEIVETVAIGVELGLEAEVPFADEPGGIPRVLQELRQRAARRREADVEPSGWGRGVGLEGTFEPHALLIPARQKRRPRRCAHWSVRVELRQPDPFAGEPIEVRGPDVRRTVAAQIAVAQVVGDDEHDVRPRLRDRAARYRSENDKETRREPDSKMHNRYRFTTVTVTFEGYCFEW